MTYRIARIKGLVSGSADRYVPYFFDAKGNPKDVYVSFIGNTKDHLRGLVSNMFPDAKEVE